MRVLMYEINRMRKAERERVFVGMREKERECVYERGRENVCVCV